jgi:hypothetical protein
LSTRACSAAKESAARDAGLSTRGRSTRPNANPTGEAFRVQPADQLDRYIDVSISSSGNDWRWKVLSRDHAQSIPAPAESYTHVRLAIESKLVDLSCRAENDIWRTIACAADAKRRAVRPPHHRVSTGSRITPDRRR